MNRTSDFNELTSQFLHHGRHAYCSSVDMVTSKLVVVGASAGGLAPLRNIISKLPAELGAAVLVIIHMSNDARSELAAILARNSRLKVHLASDFEKIEANVVYVSRPGLNTFILGDHIALRFLPDEHPKPSVDLLFKTAADSFGSSVIGVVLSGTLRDGTDGLAYIQKKGGVAVVQDPTEAAYEGMPFSALEEGAADLCATSDQIAQMLPNLVSGLKFNKF